MTEVGSVKVAPKAIFFVGFWMLAMVFSNSSIEPTLILNIVCFQVLLIIEPQLNQPKFWTFFEFPRF